MLTASPPRPVVLCIFDGFGSREDAPDNATTRAEMPHFRRVMAQYPTALLDACEEYVGLPSGQIGNSEVGHMNLGAGRVVFQDLPLIDRTIARGELEQNPALQTFITNLKASGGTCHLMGLASPGGVHAHQAHFVALAKILSTAGIPVALHAFLDGRDVPPHSAAEQIAQLQHDIVGLAQAKLVTLCGRYYAMDRDKRWERVQLAYELLVDGKGAAANDAVAAIKASYAANVADEFVLPVNLNGYGGMKDGDGLLFANFRADRARQLLTTLLDKEFSGFNRSRTIHLAAALGMVEYSEQLNALMPALFPPKHITNSLGEVVAKAGLKQLRIAETEKYPHVTFFFNGGREEPYPGEDRIMVPSPKVATYDLQPEMSAAEVTDQVTAAIDSGSYDLIILNYANPDMVGHTGSLDAAIKACETLDHCLERLIASVLRQNGVILLTADHGNCEQMFDPITNGPHTAHTLNRVPIVLINGPAEFTQLRNGKLADIAPTLLQLLGLPKPAEMDGESLIAV
jgi:2,3-bisphosphoglycerate-independent phosphoglycerate mutase